MCIENIINQLSELQNGPEQDEYGRCKPTQEVVDRLMYLLNNNEINININANIVIDSEGGIRIEWIQPNASLHLVIPDKDKSYIYYEFDNEYGTENVTSQNITFWLHKIRG